MGEQRGEIALPAAQASDLAAAVGVDLRGGAPEQLDRGHVRRIPEARCDCAARPGHPGHLGDARVCVVQEPDDQAGQRNVDAQAEVPVDSPG